MEINKNMQNKLELAISNYKLAIENIEENRKEWKDNTKTKLTETLEKISKIAELGNEIRKNETIENLESVLFYFNNSPTRINERNENYSIQYIKVGAILFFEQQYNGEIKISIELPFIENIIEKKDKKEIDTIVPQKLSEDKIYSYVQFFFDAITLWENNDTTQKIGFLQ